MDWSTKRRSWEPAASCGPASRRMGLRSPLDKFFSDDGERRPWSPLRVRTAAISSSSSPTHAVAIVHKVLGALRNRLAERYGLIPELDRSDPDAWKFAWILDFPWFEWNDEEERWDFIHHPFTGVIPETLEHFETDPGKVISKSYDITLNGWELASGSIRIHDRELQQRVFSALGIGPEEAAGALRLPPRCVPLRRAPSRGHRPGDRPDRRAGRGGGQHPRGDRLPQDPECLRPPDRSPGPGRRDAAEDPSPAVHRAPTGGLGASPVRGRWDSPDLPALVYCYPWVKRCAYRFLPFPPQDSGAGCGT